MKRKPGTYNNTNIASAVMMVIALLWLTVSLPFVYSTQQNLAKQDKIELNNSSLPGTEEEAANPFGNGTEEKSPTSGSSFSEEYLHDHHKSEYFFTIASQFHKCENAGTYIAFHGELLVPPPNLS